MLTRIETRNPQLGTRHSSFIIHHRRSSFADRVRRRHTVRRWKADGSLWHLPFVRVPPSSWFTYSLPSCPVYNKGEGDATQLDAKRLPHEDKKHGKQSEQNGGFKTNRKTCGLTVQLGFSYAPIVLRICVFVKDPR